MTRHTSRRALLQGAVLLSAAPAAALGAVPVFDVVGEPQPLPTDETPIALLFRKWEAVMEETSAAFKASDALGFNMDREDAISAAFDPVRHRIEDAIRDTPPATMRDLAIKVYVLSGQSCWALPNKTVLECALLVGCNPNHLPGCIFEDE